MNEQDLGGIGKLSRQRLSDVTRHSKGCLKASDVVDCLQVSKSKARGMLAYWAKGGWLQRIRPGLYLPVEMAAESAQDIVIDPWVVATQVFPTCYIGGWSACEYWGFTDQIFNNVIVLTSKRVNGKEQFADSIKFFLKRQDLSKQFGLKTVWKESIRVHVSDPHKTIIDILDDPILAGGIRSSSDMLEKYLQSEYFNAALLMEYAAKMKNKTIFKRLGYLVSIFKSDETALIDQCRINISQGISQIDPSSKGHRLIKKWRLWLPEDFAKTILPHGNE